MREPAGRLAPSILLLAAGLVLVVGCNRSSTPSESSDVVVGPTKIEVVQPKRQSLNRMVEQPGTIQAYEETALFARVPGYVRLAYDKEGRIIHDYGRRIRGPKYDSSGTKVIETGEILAELVVPELVQRAQLKQANIRLAEADFEQAEKLVASAEAKTAAEEAGVVEAKALYERWESESKRISKLSEGGSIDQQARLETINQFKAAGARVLSAEAAVRKARADRDKANADVKSMRARIDVAKADALEAEAMLEYSKIRAPYDGVITARKVYSGDFVQPAGGQGDWLFKVARMDPIRVVVAVPEADAELVTEKSTVKLVVQELSGASLTGTVARTSWALDIGSRTLHTEIDLPNADGRLRPGMYVYARIVNQLPECWTLPNTAILKQDDGVVCFLLEGDKAIRTQLQIGRGDGQSVQVLKRKKQGTATDWEDINGNEAVAGRAAGLTDGQSVRVGTPTK